LEWIKRRLQQVKGTGHGELRLQVKNGILVRIVREDSETREEAHVKE
jgi:hypothetical protein